MEEIDSTSDLESNRSLKGISKDDVVQHTQKYVEEQNVMKTSAQFENVKMDPKTLSPVSNSSDMNEFSRFLFNEGFTYIKVH